MSERLLNEYAQSLIEVVPEVIRGLWRREMNDLSCGSITPPQLFLLMYLNRVNEVRMTDVARYLSVTTAAATGLIDRLFKGGYVVRVYDETDRRIIRVRLTAKGASLVKKIIENKISRIKEVFGQLSDKERDDYLRVLMRIKAVVEQESARDRHA